MPEQRYTVFVSSTWLDNVERRELVRAAIEQADMVPIGMERFAAQTRPSLEVCLEQARSSDLLVCILAHRYGSIPNGHERSYTELEYEANPQHLAFLIHPDQPFHPDRDYDPGPPKERFEKQIQLALFKARIQEDDQICCEFTENSLQADVLHALQTWKAQRGGPASARPDEAPAATTAPALAPSLEWNRPDCPFPGLSAYDEDERAALYAGRDAEIDEVTDELARRLSPSRGSDVAWLQIEGASGAGKSSFARAGLVPRLRQWTEEGSLGRFRIAVLRPRDEPLRSVALALARAFPGEETGALETRLRRGPRELRDLLEEQLDHQRGERLALVIDQLEELFTYAPSERDAPEQAKRHAEQLAVLSDNLACALEAGAPLVLVTTVRRDYLGELARLEQLDALTNRAHHHVLRTMDVGQLEAAIRRPAAAAGLAWQPEELPARIARDAALAPDRLALLGHALESLWNRRDENGRLPERAYDEIGGVAGALAGQAQELSSWLRGQERKDENLGRGLRDAMLGLVRVESDGRVARKILPRNAFLDVTGLPRERAEWLLAVLSGQRVPEIPDAAPPPPRLVAVDGTGDDARVELVHELLLSTWRSQEPGEPTGLANWIDEERDRLILRDAFEAHARDWLAAGAKLLEVNVGQLYRRYRTAGATGRATERYLERARRKLLCWRTALVTALLVVGVGSWLWWAGVQRDRFDAEIQGRAEFVRNWRSAVRSDLRAWELLASVLSKPQLDRVADRRRELEEKDDPSGFESFTVRAAQELAELAPDLRLHLEESSIGVASPLTSAGRSELEALWGQVIAAYPELTPRYDFLPLRPPRRENKAPCGWEFLVLGTGDAPEPDEEQQRWIFTGATGVVVAYLPGGEFLMGSPAGVGHNDERLPSGEQRATYVSPFFLSVTEWTQGQELRLAPDPLASPDDDGALPAAELDWYSARIRAEQVGGRLPTEAQWECACRAGTRTRYWSGDEEADLARVGWYRENSRMELEPVGQKPSNPWGLHDVHGNAWEWCEDWFGNYEESQNRDPNGPPGGDARVMRGGACSNDAGRCRSAYRGGRLPSFRLGVVGFRVAFPAAPVLGTGAVGD